MDEEKFESDVTAEVKLKQLNEERKSLKIQVKDERTIRLEEVAKMRIFRDEKIEKVSIRLKKISEKIYHYNKLGKCAKDKIDIFRVIKDEIDFMSNEEIVADLDERM